MNGLVLIRVKDCSRSINSGDSMTSKLKAQPKQCLLCESKPKARGLCDKHYQKHLRGVLGFEPPKIRAHNDDEREHKFIDHQSNGCWLWNGNKDRNGAGRVGRSGVAHRWMYERKVGPVPKKSILYHECGEYSCVNPDHLKPISRSEFLALSTSTVLRECEYGHSADKIEEVVDSKGKTIHRCRICAKYS